MTTATPSNIFKDRGDIQAVGRRRDDRLYKGFSYLLLTLLALTMIAPFIWMISTSFKPEKEILRRNFFPNEATMDNYSEVINETDLPLWYKNSFIVAVFSTISVAFFDSLAGYVFAKYQFPGKRPIFIIFLTSLMVPTEMLIIPWFIMSSNPPIGGTWVDTYWGIAFPGVITASGIFLMRQFMQGVPDELLDAGRIDGVSEFGLYWRGGRAAQPASHRRALHIQLPGQLECLHLAPHRHQQKRDVYAAGGHTAILVGSADALESHHDGRVAFGRAALDRGHHLPALHH